jgi:hypothetical protein
MPICNVLDPRKIVHIITTRPGISISAHSALIICTKFEACEVHLTPPRCLHLEVYIQPGPGQILLNTLQHHYRTIAESDLTFSTIAFTALHHGCIIQRQGKSTYSVHQASQRQGVLHEYTHIQLIGRRRDRWQFWNRIRNSPNLPRHGSPSRESRHLTRRRSKRQSPQPEMRHHFRRLRQRSHQSRRRQMEPH